MLILLAALALAVVLSLAVGANPLSLETVSATLRGEGSAETDYILFDLRIPRTFTGLVAGAALGVAGALIQAFTRNPLADPGILGVNAGAALAVALGVSVLGLRDVSQFVWLAFLGALVVTIAVYLIGASGRGSADPLRLTLMIRWTFGVDQRSILPLSAVLAPIILLLADVLGRIIIAPAEVPVGIVAAFIGAPVLILLARRRSASAL